ncbi:MAG TPA: WYL domain-containing protein [Caulobacteraceae bacterium]|jgi:predicted DNA-binding transcriptional regulator YafY
MRHEKAGTLLELARELAASAEGLTLDEMARSAGVGRRTAERMRDAIWALFPQMEELADGPSKRFRIPHGLDGFFQSPTVEELAVLSNAASGLRLTGAGPRAAVLESLERKVRAAMRSAALRRVAPDLEALARSEAIAVQAGPRPFEDEAVVAKIRQALLAMKALSFAYDGGSRPGARRTVTPFGLMFGRMNYLVAADGDGEPRNFRLDRLRNLEVTDHAAAAPEDFSLQAYAAASFGIYQGDVEDVALRILPAGADDALRWRFHPTQTVEPRADGSVVVRFRASGMRELAWHLVTWVDKVEILAPASLRETMLAELEQALAAHRRAPAG